VQQRRVVTGAWRPQGPGAPLLSLPSDDAQPARFDSDILADLDREIEVDVETLRDDGTPKRTTIWVIVDDGEVFARSWKGDDGVWYRHVRSRPDDVILHVSGRAVAARAISATDEDSVERTSRGLEKKYRGDPSTPAMVASKILHTTVRFEPREER